MPFPPAAAKWREQGMHARPHHAATLAFVPLTLALTHERAAAFDYFEHRWIGDVACGLYAGDADACVLWRDTVGGLGAITFGDLTALVGDHYGTPQELAAALIAIGRTPEGTPACSGVGADREVDKLCTVLAYRELELAFARVWLAEGGSRRLGSDLEACASLTPWLVPVEPWDDPGHSRIAPPALAIERGRDELETAARALDTSIPPRYAGDCFAPPDHLVARLRGLPDRIALAAGDATHFGARALAAWRSHQRAAIAAHARGDRVLALAHEAFALHFLSDLFAAGHIRNPRESHSHSLAEVMRYHDQDNATGLLVEASTSPLRRWYAYGDRCLFGAAARDNRAMLVSEVLMAIGSLRHPEVAWTFSPPRLSALDITPVPASDTMAPVVLGLYAGVGVLAGPSGAPSGVELVVAHDWQLTTWWNPLLDLRHGIASWGDGTLVIELASAPLMELLTLPALPFVALSAASDAEALRRFGKGIDHAPEVHFGPLTLRLDADVGVGLVRAPGASEFRPHLLVRSGVSLEVPDRWRFFVPRATLLSTLGDGAGSWRLALTTGVEHTF